MTSQIASLSDQVCTIERAKSLIHDELKNTRQQMQDFEDNKENLAVAQSQMNKMKEGLIEAAARESDLARRAKEMSSELQNADRNLAKTISELAESHSIAEALRAMADEKNSLAVQVASKDNMLRLQEEKLVELTDQLVALEAEIYGLGEELQKCQDENAHLRDDNGNLSTKCQRLRDYIRKLTNKCDEWESFHASESRLLQTLKDAHHRTRAIAADLAERYQEAGQVS
jgi:chromosome segregation ATPase